MILRCTFTNQLLLSVALLCLYLGTQINIGRKFLNVNMYAPMPRSVRSTPTLRQGKKHKGKSLQDNKQEQFTETESTHRRTPMESKHIMNEDKKPERPKMPVLIRVVSILHIILVSLCLVAVVHFYNEYINKKQDNAELDKETGFEAGKMVLSAVLAGLISFSRAYLVQRYE